MVRLGKVAPKIWEDLEQQGVSQDSIEEAAAAAAEAAKEKAAQLAKEALSEAANIDWKATADAAKEAREIDEKYGIFKDIVMSAWFKKVLGVWDKIRSVQLLGEPRMAPTAIIILLFMLLRAKQPTHVLVLFAAFFYNVHPILIVSVSGALWLWARVRKPKGLRVRVKGQPGGIDESLCVATPLAQAKLPEVVDHIIIGSDIGGLFCGALLSRLGHKVLVLEGSKAVGGCSITHKGVPFDWGFHSLGHVEVYEELLGAAVLEGSPQIRWVKIGSEADGFSYDLATVGSLGDVVYRAGRAALIDDQVTTAPDFRDKVGPFVGKVDTAAREQHGFFVGKLFKPSTTVWLQSMLGSTYNAAAGHSAEHIFKSNLPEIDKLDLLRGVFRHENLKPSDLSFAAYTSALSHGLDGMSYPVGGYQAVARALISTIRSAGGQVLTEAPVKAILLDDDNKVATGVKLEGGAEPTVTCRSSVISATGVVPTYTTLLPPKVALPAGVCGVKEAKPRLYLLVVLKGTDLELDLPATDYYQIPTDDTPHEWLHISFPSAKDPNWHSTFPDQSTCVVEVEADDDMLELVCRKDTAPAPPARPQQPPTGSPSKANAGSKGAEERGLHYYKWKPPSDAKTKRMSQALLRRLVEVFPQLDGKVEEHGMLGPFRAGLSHTPARFKAVGLRPSTAIKRLYLCGKDLTLGTFAGGLYGGWLAAHAVTGYTAMDVLLFQRNLIKDLKNVNGPAR